MIKNNKIFSLKKGEKMPISIKLHNRDEDKPIDLTNAKIRFQLKDELKDNFYILEKFIDETTDVYTEGRIIDAKNGLVIIRFNDDDYSKLVEERIYYITLWWEIPEEDFAKVISGNASETFAFKVCYP